MDPSLRAGRKGKKETSGCQSGPDSQSVLRPSGCFWFSTILYLVIGICFMATVKRLCDYKEENFRLMQELALERQKEGLSVW